MFARTIFDTQDSSPTANTPHIQHPRENSFLLRSMEEPDSKGYSERLKGKQIPETERYTSFSHTEMYSA